MRGSPETIKKIVFLTYLSRSGSTLLSNNLNHHPEICVTQEGEFPGELLGIKGYKNPTLSNEWSLLKYLNFVWNVSRIKNWKIDKQEVLSVVDDYPITGSELFRIFLSLNRQKHKPDSNVVIYKGVPAMPWEISNIATRYPDASFINLIRDPRSIEFSQSNNKLPYENRKFSISPLQTAYEWKKAIIGSHSSNANVLNIRFEDFINRNEDVMESIFDFLEVKNSPLVSKGSFSKEIPEEERYLHKKVNQQPDASRIDAWKEFGNDLKWRLIEKVCQDEMQQLGYDSNGSTDTLRINLAFGIEVIKYRLLDTYYRMAGIMKRFLSSPSFYLKKVRLLLGK